MRGSGDGLRHPRASKMNPRHSNNLRVILLTYVVGSRFQGVFYEAFEGLPSVPKAYRRQQRSRLSDISSSVLTLSWTEVSFLDL
jgi:hypothetical protein